MDEWGLGAHVQGAGCPVCPPPLARHCSVTLPLCDPSRRSPSLHTAPPSPTPPPTHPLSSSCGNCSVPIQCSCGRLEGRAVSRSRQKQTDRQDRRALDAAEKACRRDSSGQQRAAGSGCPISSVDLEAQSRVESVVT